MRIEGGWPGQTWVDPPEESDLRINIAEVSPAELGPGSQAAPLTNAPPASPWQDLPPAAVQAPPPEPPNAPLPELESEPESPAVPPDPRASDPGDRTPDYALMQRHEAWAQRMEAYWAELSQLSSFRASVGQGEQDLAAQIRLAELRPPEPEDEPAPPEPSESEPAEPEPLQELPEAQRLEPAPWVGAAFDDEGNLMPGVVDPEATPEQQQSQLVQHLQEQGLSLEEAAVLTYETLGAGMPAPLHPPAQEVAAWTAEQLQARVDEVEEFLQQELLAQQAREDSLLSADDLLQPAGGPGRAAGRTPAIQPVLNGNFDAALNAAGDVAGLLQPFADLQQALGQLQTAQAESRIESLRVAMRAAGMSNVPNDYERAWLEGGAMVKDYGATARRLQSAYQDFLTDRRYTETWGSNWRDLRIGRSQMTVAEFETTVLRLQQRATNEAYERGKLAIATGEMPLRGSYVLTLGNFIDGQVRNDLRDFGKEQGLPDSAGSNLYAVNRMIRGEGLAGIPDLLIGRNLMSDVSLASKNGNYDQLRRWNTILPNDTIIMRPIGMPGGGAYVVPRTTISPVIQPGRGG